MIFISFYKTPKPLFGINLNNSSFALDFMIQLLKNSLITFILCLSVSYSSAQILTKEDSLSAGLTGRTNNYSALSGYGEAKVNYDLRSKTGTANLTRNVLFFGHKFSNTIYFFSEMEIENAKVTGGGKGEISMEQLFLKFNINPSNYVTAGLFIPRIGLINENHLPTTFNGNDRPTVERLVIPSTWREIGISYYGSSINIRGLNYSASIFNGLNSQNFEFGNGIREGRMEGSMAPASNIAVSAALLYYIGHFRLQYSTYFGGSAGLDKIASDSLKLNNGMFGTPIHLNEANLRFSNNLFEFKALIAVINIPNAKKINNAYHSNMSQIIYGGYFEAGLHLLQMLNNNNKKVLTIFSRIETLDLNYKIPDNAIKDNFQSKLISVSGITFVPANGIAIKADYVWQKTGNYNSTLHSTNPTNPYRPFHKTNHYINIGLAYSF